MANNPDLAVHPDQSPDHPEHESRRDPDEDHEDGMLEESFDDDGSETFDTTTCMICAGASDPHLVLLCDNCPNEAHLGCVGLKYIPEGQWFCPACTSEASDLAPKALAISATATAAAAAETSDESMDEDATDDDDGSVNDYFSDDDGSFVDHTCPDTELACFPWEVTDQHNGLDATIRQLQSADSGQELFADWLQHRQTRWRQLRSPFQKASGQEGGLHKTSIDDTATLQTVPAPRPPFPATEGPRCENCQVRKFP